MPRRLQRRRVRPLKLLSIVLMRSTVSLSPLLSLPLSPQWSVMSCMPSNTAWPRRHRHAPPPLSAADRLRLCSRLVPRVRSRKRVWMPIVRYIGLSYVHNAPRMPSTIYGCALAVTMPHQSALHGMDQGPRGSPSRMRGTCCGYTCASFVILWGSSTITLSLACVKAAGRSC